MLNYELEEDVIEMVAALARNAEHQPNETLRRVLPHYMFLTRQIGSIATVSEGEQAKLNNERLEVKSSKSAAKTQSDDGLVQPGKIRWVDDVKTALRRMGGEASLHEIYKSVEKIRSNSGRSTPKTLEATIRRTIEDHSEDSENFRVPKSIFRRTGRGRWRLE